MMMRTLVVLMLALATAAAAQSGPAPGYEDGLSYARDHAISEASKAVADPTGTVQSKANPEAIEKDVAHTAYMACWIADDAGVQPPGCDAYYTAPQRVDPVPDPGEATPAEVEEAVEEVDALANATGALVEEVVEDPASAPSALERFVQAVAAAASALAGLVLSLVQGALDAVQALGSSTAAGLDAAAGAVARWSQDVAGATEGVAKRVADGVEATATFVADAAKDLVDAAASRLHDLFYGSDPVAEVPAAAPEAPAPVEDTVDGLLDIVL